MRQDGRILVALAAMSLLAGEAAASGVGASIYIPAKARPVVQQASCQTGVCGPTANCGACQRLGFACVDHATPAPCTAEGGCYPARESFGYNTTRWRRWPGADYGGPSPEAAAPGDDALLPSFEAPKPEEEDQHAPPPIDDSDEDDTENASDLPAPRPGAPALPGGGGVEGPGIEIDLPALPEGPIPTPRPQAPGFRDAPPSLPFGYQQPGSAPAQTAPAQPVRRLPVSSRPMLSSPRDDGPPPLPHGFTSTPAERLLRRLPNAAPRYDAAIQQASAQRPLR